MQRSTTYRLGALAFGIAALATTGLSSTANGQAAAAPDPLRNAGKHTVMASGLDNPRQLNALSGGRLLVAQAGHGSYKKKNCVDGPEGPTCIGFSGKVSSLPSSPNDRRKEMRGLLSGAGPDGTFATGPDGASRAPDGTYYAVITYAPPEFFPAGIPGRQAGKLIAKRSGHKKQIVADITAYERRHDVDGEGFDSNPYSVLALKKKVLVADAAGDSVLAVDTYGKGKGRVSLWHAMKEYGPKIDPVPTTLSLGADGKVYIGELHSEVPKEARVWRLTKGGKVLGYRKGFTTVTGVTRTADGTMYVSELFGGSCGFDQIPTCFPGQVTRIKHGKRTSVSVPFPAGIASVGNKVFVSAFSTSPSKGFGGNPDWSGQIWRLQY